MESITKKRLITFLIALVWLLNGLFCKVLNLVPRHQQIVARILGDENSRIFTLLIGFSEIIMALWVLSRYKSKICATTQIVVVAVMNILEFILVPDLLLWGRLNSLFALIFLGVVFYHEFNLCKIEGNL